MTHPEPYAHQQEALNLSKNRESFAFLMEMGTGKTRPTIETADYLHASGQIEALVVFAPNGVQHNWVLNEIPRWSSSKIRSAHWVSSPTKKLQAKLDHLVARPFDGLRVFVANYEATRSEKFKVFIKKFLSSFKTLMVLDESTRIKNSSGQSKFILSLRDLAPYRRIMSGLVTPNSPFDIYRQFYFLDPKILGFKSYFSFEAHFGILEDNHHLLNAIKKRSGSSRTPQLIKKDKNKRPMYKNLDQLYELIKDHSYRRLKSDCLDLPDKVFKKVIVELTTKQRKIYETVREEIISEFETGTITAQLPMVRLMRLQQVAGGFVKFDDETLKPIDDIFPKLDALVECIESTSGKVAIWTHFQSENELIADKLRSIYGKDSVVQYYGKISTKEKQLAVDRFSNLVRDENNVTREEDTGCRFWVGEPHSGGIGLQLVLAETVFYYSNNYVLEDRLQSEDRHHRSGTKHVVTYIDIEAKDTCDSKIIDSLRMKKNIAAYITRDTIKDWI